MTTSENIQSTIAQLVEPLRDQLDELDKEIELTAQNLHELRRTKHGVVAVLNRLDPTFVTVATEKSDKPSKKTVKGASPGTVATVREFIMAHVLTLNENGGFSGARLREMPEYHNMFSQQITVNALRELHSEGTLRLDHTGVAGSRFYKVVV